jgi:hypothetical protein
MTNPTSSTVSTVASIIFATFEVSATDAREQASGLVLLAEGWGGNEAKGIRWDEIVRIRFAEQLKWRSEHARKDFIESKRQTADAYENYIRARK